MTVKMEEGILVQEEEEAREQRRQLRTYGFATGERHFGVDLYSSRLGITALIDLVILRPDGREEVVPVDYKLARMGGQHFKVQLACYALLLEEEMGLPAPSGFLYLIPERRAEKVALPPALKRQALGALMDMRGLIEAEAMPEPCRQRARCVNCEFRRFCNDVL